MVFFRSTYEPVMPVPGGPGGLLAPQYLAAQLTLFQPGEGRLSQPITTAPPKFFHRHQCDESMKDTFFFDSNSAYSAGRGSKFNSWCSMCVLGSFPMVFNKFMYSFDVVLKEELGYLNSTKASQRVDLHGYFTSI